ncbi:hypothetical protein ASG11_16295 [Sphingomonas sp. Leaf357]|uniref:hypothetical protein n=1 Tax=Sphingomonas sp. Leaf357 TaxID=1736350 RepID=UPI0006FB2914|nr:hypothetical protein [Sphingomonas sp. Leaf357]KQS02320.1 hypothetical protein ASG11_16295 [Sphingomonas sp. Leaf357]
MTTGQLHTLLIARLTRTSGGTARGWRIALGPIKVRSAATHVHCNWEVEPSGTEREIAAIERLLDQVRLDHPLVTID